MGAIDCSCSWKDSVAVSVLYIIYRRITYVWAESLTLVTCGKGRKEVMGVACNRGVSKRSPCGPGLSGRWRRTRDLVLCINTCL